MLSSYLARLTVTWVGSLARPNTDVLAQVHLPLHIWPSDLDVWGHVNNGRYLTLMDHGRLDHGLRTGLVAAMWRLRCRPLLGEASVQYLRELRAFDRCTLVTQLVAWDERALYFEHRLERAGELCARALVRAVPKVGRKRLAPADLLEEVGVHTPSPLAPPLASSLLSRPGKSASTFAPGMASAS